MKGHARSVLSLLVLLSVLALTGCSQEELVEATFPAGLHGHLVPATLTLPENFADTGTVWVIAPPQCLKAKKAYGQEWADSADCWPSGAPRRKVTFLWDPATGSKEKTFYYYFHHPKAEDTAIPAFSFADDGESLELRQDGKPVLAYVHGMRLAPGAPEDRRRSSYVHPVWSLDGTPLSDDFPADHLHHRGIFWTWPKVLIGADSLSLWDIRGIHQRFERWLEQRAGASFARLGVENGWYAGDRKVAREEVWITAYQADTTGRAIDFDLTWTALEQPITLIGAPEEDKGYGGFCFRMAPFDQPALTTPEGLQAGDSDRVPAPWADFSARFGGQDSAGVTILAHPENPGFPTGWTLRTYGFLGTAWPGLEPFVLEPGRPLRLRYRVWLHRGDSEDGMSASAFVGYTEPARALLVRARPKSNNSSDQVTNQ